MHNNFHEFVLHNDLYQLVKEPTRNNNILNLLLSSHPDLFRLISIQPSIGNSDHDVVSFQFLSSNLSSRGEQSSGSGHNFGKADFKSINAALLNVSWAHVFANYVHINQNWGNVYAIIEHIIKTFVPLKKKCTKISSADNIKNLNYAPLAFALRLKLIDLIETLQIYVKLIVSTFIVLLLSACTHHESPFP